MFEGIWPNSTHEIFNKIRPVHPKPRMKLKLHAYRLCTSGRQRVRSHAAIHAPSQHRNVNEATPPIDRRLLIGSSNSARDLLPSASVYWIGPLIHREWNRSTSRTAPVISSGPTVRTFGLLSTCHAKTPSQCPEFRACLMVQR